MKKVVVASSFLFNFCFTGLVVFGQGAIEYTVKAPFQSVSPTADGTITAGEYSNSLFLSFADRANPGTPWPNLDHMCPTNCDLDSGSPTAFGDDDLSATMYLSHTDKYLFLGFDVTDGFLDFSGIGPGDAFKNDAVELYIDADADGADAHGGAAGPFENYQIVADASDGNGGPALTAADMEFNNRYADRGITPVGKAPPVPGEYYTAGLVHSDKNYVIEYQIPLGSLDTADGDDEVAAKTGDTLRFTAVIDDNDYDGSQGQDTYGELWYIEGDTRSNWGGAEDNWVVGLELSSAVVTKPGDFDQNGALDAADIDALTAVSGAGTNNKTYDLNSDNLVNSGDVNVWAKDLRKTWIGDANVDGEFNSGDFVQVFTKGKYENGSTAVWTEGDWNGDGKFDSGDFVTAFTDGGYEKGPLPAVASVPEPSSLILALSGLLMIVGRRRRS